MGYISKIKTPDNSSYDIRPTVESLQTLDIQSDWNQSGTTLISYIKNKPDVRSSSGTKSLVLNDISHNTADGQYSTAEGETTSALGEASHVEGIGIKHNNIPFTIDEFIVSEFESSSFNSSDFSGHVGDIIIFDGIVGTYTVSAIRRLTITFTPSLLSPKATKGEILVEGTNSGAYGNASHAEGSGTTAWGTSSHAEGSSEITLSEYTLTGEFEEIDRFAIDSPVQYMPVSGDAFYIDGTQGTYRVKYDDGGDKFYFAPKLDSIPLGSQTIYVTHFDSGAVGDNSHVEGLETIALNDNEHAEGHYNASHTGNTDAEKTQHSVGIGDSTTRKNAFEIMQNGDAYLDGVGGYDGTNPNGTGVKTLQESISKPEVEIVDTTNNLAGYRGMLAKRKVYTDVLGVVNGSDAPNNNTWANRSVYFLTVHPRSFDSEWTIHYRVNVHLYNENQLYKSSSTASVLNIGQLCRGNYDCTLSGTASIYNVFHMFQSQKNTSYRPIYYHIFHGPTSAGFDEGYKIGVSFVDSYLPIPTNDWSSGSKVTNVRYSRTIEVIIDDCTNCTAELNDVLEIESDAYTANDTNEFANYNKLDSTYFTTATSSSNTAGRWASLSAATQGLYELSDDNDTSTVSLPYTKLTAGTNGIMAASLVMQDSDGNWQSFTTTSGASTSSVPANKTPNTTTAFRPGSPIYYVNISNPITSGTITTGTARAYVALFNLRYSINAYSSVAGKPLYIKGTIHNDGYFYIDGNQSDLTVPWWTQEPNVTNDGVDRIYIKVSEGLYDTYRTDLISSGEMWHFNSDGEFCRYFDTSDASDTREEDNAVLLSGYCSELGHFNSDTLFAMSDIGTLQAIYDDVSQDYTTETFSIGTPIYVYKGSDRLQDVDVKNLEAYISHHEVHLSMNGITVDAGFPDKFGAYDSVWLEVSVTGNRWAPIDITGTYGLSHNGFYIYLGRYTGDINGQSQPDVDTFMLEIENNLYYYNHTNKEMTLYDLWKVDDVVGDIEAALAAL